MDLCFIDTETTGLHPDLHEVWEVAIIKCAEDGTVSRLWMMLPLMYMENADPFALNIGKFWERYKKNGDWDGIWSGERPERPEKGEYVEDEREAARMIREFTHGASLVGNVVSFDSERLGRFLREWGQTPTWHYHVLDIEPMIYGAALAQGKKFPLPYRSKDLTEWLDVPEPDEELRHTAMGDAEWVRAQWECLQNLGEEVLELS